MPELYVDALIDLNRFYRAGAASSVNDAVERITGKPALAFERFVSDHLNAWH